MKNECCMENEVFKLEFDSESAAIKTFFIKPLDQDLLGEKRLAALFNLRLQHPDYECDYAVENRPKTMDVARSSAEIYFDNIRTERGQFPLSLRLWIQLDGPAVRFRARLENQSCVPVAEFWFPCLGGVTRFGERPDTEVFWPGYFGPHFTDHLSRFPTALALGDQVPESVMMPTKHPYLTMPWFNIHNTRIDKGLYFGYHDELLRIHANRFAYHPCPGPNIPGDNWPTPRQLGADEPTGIVYSHIRFPYISRDDAKAGAVFEHGEFVIQLHDGDWHDAAPIYRSWWDEHFTAPEEPSWLRRRTAWLSTMLLQPEDRINTDYEGLVQWAKDARDFGINTVEICAWDKGGQDRDYPHYVPDDRLGGEKGFKKMLKALADAGIDPVLFGNYNTVNCETQWYRDELHKYVRMDEFGNCENWLCWGQSTIQARHALSVRRQLWASASIPDFNEIIAAYFTKLADWGVKAMQWDKTGSSEALLDFNPLSTMPPDTSMPEGTVRSCRWLLEKCREVQSDFCVASEACSDRYIPFIDVFYRGASVQGVSPIRYVFPEWTTCLHVSSPFDFEGVNAAVRFGCVLAVEPQSYKAGPKHPWYRQLMTYVKEINRLREELNDLIFLSRWLDDRGARVVWNDRIIQSRTASTAKDPGGIVLLAGELPAASGDVPLAFSVHEGLRDGRRSIVVVNNSRQTQRYQWAFTHKEVPQAKLYAPFDKPTAVSHSTELSLPPQRLHVIVESHRK